MNLVLEGSPDSDQEELDVLTLQLREQLLGLEVDQVELKRLDAAPTGAKPGEAIALGSLVVTVAPIALRAVLSLLETWIGHRPIRAVTVTMDGDSLEVHGISSAEQRQLIDVFAAAHGSAPSPAADLAPAPESHTRTGGGT
ncbi:hypothetical protein [Streptomyces sp. NPDC005303]|uniref:hypothetical protein n=1 Tax=Streptomyces sp. NPDC005303 TaxID=3155713 RepID=UPI0033A7F322